MLALAGPILGLIAAPAAGATKVLASMAAELGLRFWCGTVVGLTITDSTVRSDAIGLVKAVVAIVI